MKIGELAKITDTPVETIRFYEKQKLLPLPKRSDNNYRQYSSLHTDRLLFIRHCRSLDMTLDEIRTLLLLQDSPQLSCKVVDRFLEEHIGHVKKRIQELLLLEKQLLILRSTCTHTQNIANCGIMNALSCNEICALSRHTSHEHDCTHIACTHAKTHNIKMHKN